VESLGFFQQLGVVPNTADLVGNFLRQQGNCWYQAFALTDPPRVGQTRVRHRVGTIDLEAKMERCGFSVMTRCDDVDKKRCVWLPCEYSRLSDKAHPSHSGLWLRGRWRQQNPAIREAARTEIDAIRGRGLSEPGRGNAYRLQYPNPTLDSPARVARKRRTGTARHLGVRHPQCAGDSLWACLSPWCGSSHHPWEAPSACRTHMHSLSPWWSL